MKDWSITYWKNGEQWSILLRARTRQSVLNKFRRDYGYYTIVEIKEMGR